MKHSFFYFFKTAVLPSANTQKIQKQQMAAGLCPQTV